MKTNKNTGIAVIAMLLVLGISGTALAASSDSIVAGGTGLGGNFDKQLALICGAFVTLAKVTVLVMTAVAAMMVGWGIEDGKKTMVARGWPCHKLRGVPHRDRHRGYGQ